ncbi:2-keto-3-deoxy-L-rhamnonate aldolase RhmA [Meinhardsimonia xiamenensis]|jgi:2-keto-3-deoxy-L-rhamnonate aldolase RhmA|uniref:2-keto-3-deoxy-L-rhamnonate aldolase RhmA n=1 Tax=Meinhardsimonia xiamenensis TaxID=990712 RepID=A0A1G9B5Y3_9RHOB|nr:aldolase/citrate lyase family protein [Meinhardsimonia xiamenensis]PRX35106.1 2-keto-3-deoxy-L-rhamnonate aldolase RhmA [Meinhardsimonia xiamenensis]SDK34961.1 2-keto-3-deoxy-L-rhamnonate aldolase RhmA [Meinhardsimonia xiamenensis]
MKIARFRERMRAGESLVGTFQKTPAIEVTETLARTGLDFVCLDAEHSAFDRARMDACLAISRALDFPVLVRVPAFTPQDILQALDSGAVGVVVPHVWSVERAQGAAAAARFGRGGRGFAGATRWAGLGGRPMAELLEQSRRETVVIAQIEEPEGLEAVDEIAAVEGIDGLFLGPADMTVALGETQLGSEALERAAARIGEAARKAGKTYMSFFADAAAAEAWRKHGVSMFFIASELQFMAASARATVAALRQEN